MPGISLQDNVHQLTRPHLTRRPDGQYVTQPPLLAQLRASIYGGGRGSGRAHNEPKLPINEDAMTLWTDIDDDVRLEEYMRTGTDQGRLTDLITAWGNEDRPDWTGHLEHATLDIIDRIRNLLDPPPSRRKLTGIPCPDCGHKWAQDENGYNIPALTAGVYDEHGATRHVRDMDIRCERHHCGFQRTGADPDFHWKLHVLADAQAA